MPQAPGPSLPQPVETLHGVGSERAQQLHRLAVHTVLDLLLLPPRRYEDRRHLLPIGRLAPGETAATRGRIVDQGVKRWRGRSRSVFEFVLADGTGRLHCRWWNLPYMQQYFEVGQEVLVFGKVRSAKPMAMDHPETEVIMNEEENSLHLNRVVPIYPLTEGLSQRWLRALVWQTLQTHASTVAEPWPGIDLSPAPDRAEAIRALHFPAELAAAEQARERLALDEFIELQLGIQRRRRNLYRSARGLPCGGNNRLMRPFLDNLDFRLTEAQTRVMRQMRTDLAGPHPMRRLLQGDVGSGKTVVAACVALMALESGFNSALMAPTEILAEQHWRVFRGWFEPLGVRVKLILGGGRTEDTPVRAEQGEAPGTLAIGTHALLEGGYAPENLGLVVIDEQHRFGVVQRERLVKKGRYPHLLVMTATPIPRTLGLTLYGDLDVSVIDALPSGRGRLRTFVRSAASLPKVWEFLRGKLAQGRQAYVVYPRVEEADDARGLKAVLSEFTKLEKLLDPYRVGLLHGRLKSDEKEVIMGSFRDGRLHVLVASSVVEVGVDVANATVMVIDGASQFGLAQLHQLRGRVGRGSHESFCILIATSRTREARERLRVMEETCDGFRIAEADLRLRGPGELLGQAQSGMPRFRFGNLVKDLALVERARTLAAQLLERETSPQPHGDP